MTLLLGGLLLIGGNGNRRFPVDHLFCRGVVDMSNSIASPGRRSSWRSGKPPSEVFNTAVEIKTESMSVQKRRPELSVRPRLKRVRNPRNSVCISAALEDLDWKRWGSDENLGSFCLEIPRKADKTLHHVYCRDAQRPGLAQRRGGLCWVYS